MRVLSLGAILMAMSALPLTAISQVTLASDGSYVSGSEATLAPDGSYVGNYPPIIMLRTDILNSECQHFWIYHNVFLRVLNNASSGTISSKQ